MGWLRCLVLVLAALGQPRAVAAAAPLRSPNRQPAAAGSPSPDFASGVLPILSKAGCNTGACHGAATGQGGFRLSLFGTDPRADWESITREFEGRRIERGAPAHSLLLRKATLAIPHGGGRRFSGESAFGRRLSRWIAGGASYGVERSPVSLAVTPAESLLPKPGSRVALRVVARFAEGRRHDATNLALYAANDPGIAYVTETGLVTVRRRGVTAIMVRYLGQVAAVRVGVPFGTAPVDPRDFPARNFIDREVGRELVRLRLPASPIADDATFLRRVFLDLTGTLPTPEEVRAFLAESQAERTNGRVEEWTSGGAGKRAQVRKEQGAPGTPTLASASSTRPLVHSSAPSTPARDRLVERLLDRSEFVDYWTLKLADLLGIHSGRIGASGARAYHAWLRDQVARNTPFDRLARALLTAQGSVAEDGAAGFYLGSRDPRDTAEFVSRAFLGTRLQCARCHNHPLDQWTQNDYYGFAAFFTQLRSDGSRVSVAERSELDHPRTGRPVPPRLLGVSSVPAADDDRAVRRVRLSAWLTSPGNRLFAETAVNRVWKDLLGRGLVEPVDDLRASNPAANPRLLRALAATFIREGYDLKRLIRTIATSRTYQLASRSNATNGADDRFNSHARARPVVGPVLADAIAQATGVAFDYAGYPPGTRAIQLLDPQVPSYTLDVFGRCRRDGPCESSRGGGGLAQALHVINDPALNERIRQGEVARLLEGGRPDRQTVETLYLRTLSRPPDDSERRHWDNLLRQAPDRREVVEDQLWALLNCREFAFNH